MPICRHTLHGKYAYAGRGSKLRLDFGVVVGHIDFCHLGLPSISCGSGISKMKFIVGGLESLLGSNRGFAGSKLRFRD